MRLRLRFQMVTWHAHPEYFDANGSLIVQKRDIPEVDWINAWRESENARELIEQAETLHRWAEAGDAFRNIEVYVLEIEEHALPRNAQGEWVIPHGQESA